MAHRLYARVRFKQPQFGKSGPTLRQSDAARSLKGAVWSRAGFFARLDSRKDVEDIFDGSLEDVHAGRGADIYMPENVK